MPSTTSLITSLQRDFRQFSFVAGHQFRWSPNKQTIFYDATSPDDASLLHELSHALLGHADYTRDIQLIGMERDAWAHATTLAASYSVTIVDDVIQDALDTYRDWLHARSLCPDCHAVGMQTQKETYTCIACRTAWHVNEARVCQLRRHKIT